MTPFAGAPWRPLAVLGVLVLGAHALVLRGAPQAIDWRHLQGTGSLRVRSVEAAPVAVHVPVATDRAPADARPRRAGTTARPEVATATIDAAPAVASAAPAAPPVTLRLPASARWRFAATQSVRGIARSGEAELAWRAADGRYTATLQVRVAPALARTQVAHALVDAGGLQPVRFGDRRRSEEATHFDRARGRIVFSSNRPDASLQPAAQDRVSVLLQLAAMVAADPARFAPGTAVTLQVATTREAIDWTFVADGAEALDLPAGRVHAIRFTRAAQREFDLRLEVWLVPGPDYGPVRLRLTPPNGDWLDMQWSGTDKG